MNINLNELISKVNSIPHVRFILKELINIFNADSYSKEEIDNIFIKSESVRTIVVLTQAQYDALTTKDTNTEYNIIESV